MSNWKLRVGNTTHEVEVRERGYGEYEVEVDGQRHPVVVQAADWGLEIRVPGGPTVSVPRAATGSAPAPGGSAPAAAPTGRVAPDVKAKPAPSPVPAKPASKPAPVALSGNVIAAPMPGKVVSISVEAGKDVEAGQVVCVLESMKMENSVAAPRAGKIKAVHVRIGDTPNTGQPIAEYE